ncbi:MAG: hypothetical protein H7X88_02275 [Gloeobacteraceae cyanobacterium ES-bin-316]|nr:hypothetical protein [Ferruginibacter sp.]
MTKKIATLVMHLLLANHLFAQENKCAWNDNNLQKEQHNISSVKKNAEAFLRLQQTADMDSIYTLPVVVHVIHTGSPVGAADNPSDAAINAMINNLNNAYRRNGASFGGADIKIQFNLALRSPACGSTSGIVRVNGSSVPDYVSGGITNFNFAGSAPETAVKRLSRWPNTDYINIWIVHKINGSNTSPGGYAYFPEYNSAITDGIVLLSSVVDGSNKTIVHEMGHYFYLYHSFADGGAENSCAANTDCATQGDLICDTEPCVALFGCSATTNTCSGNPFIVTDVPLNYTVLNNYMGYGNCAWMFTQGQKVRTRAALFSFRNGLINSAALIAPDGLSPTAACAPVALFGLSPFYGVERVAFNSLQVYSNSSEADSAFYIDRSCNQRTTVVKGQAYNLGVTGCYENTHRIKVLIDYNNNGNFNDAGETVLNVSQGMAATTVTIPLNAITEVPLRMRVLADNPVLPEPTACQLTGSVTEGAGQIEDYAVVVLRRQVISQSSGPWNAPSTWLCNCVPQGDDEVLIKTNHSVTVTAAMGILQCDKLTLETGANISVSGTGLSVNGRK